MKLEVEQNKAGLSTLPQAAPASRLWYLDNIRSLMIILVVLMHLNVTYSGMGSWYYLEGARLDTFSHIIFGIYGSLTQAYFMGFLFFIAGFFTARSYDKKGPGPFIKDRSLRLGIPTLVFMFLLGPLTSLIMGFYSRTLPSSIGQAYLQYVISFDFLGGSGPLWFALALLLFSLIYALLRMASEQGGKTSVETTASFLPGHHRIVIIIIIISVLTFLTRLVQPIGTNILNMQLCYFSQYIVLFALGILACRHKVLNCLPHRLGIIWFKLALVLGLPLWSLLMIFGGALTNSVPFNGGWHWQAAVYSVWESFFCVGICLGLLVIFRDYYNRQGPLGRLLAQNSFAVYVIHAPLLVAITMPLRELEVYPPLKMLLVFIIALPLCLAFAHLLRKITPINRIVS